MTEYRTGLGGGVLMLCGEELEGKGWGIADPDTLGMGGKVGKRKERSERAAL